MAGPSVPARLAFAALLMGGCSDGPGYEPSEGLQFTVRDSTGVEVVENRAPAWRPGDEWTIDPEPALELGAVDGPEPELFARIVSATRLADGAIALVEGASFEVRVFGADGAHRVSFGRNGEGPGEFGDPPILASFPEDTILVWDARHRRLSRFDATGEFVDDRSRAAALLDAPVNFLQRGDNWFVRPDGTLLTLSPELEARLQPGLRETGVRPVLLLTTRETVTDLGYHPTQQGIRVELSENVSASVNNPFAPASAVTMGSPATPVWVGDPEAWEVRGYDADGVLRRVVRWDAPRVAVDPEMVEWERGWQSGDGLRAFDELPIPESIPAIASLHTSRDGYLWVGHRGHPRFVISRFSVFDPDGRWLGDVGIPGASPENPLEVLEVGDDYLLVRRRDEFLLPYLRLYEIGRAP